ncbi:Crp/Fnr family transcriptional regulator [Candidatus Daviesbacteria bacterium]|nr:Crp/Fnr family transcriptional regulator [Candidatus Daviesbacteria bacterium]
MTEKTNQTLLGLFAQSKPYTYKKGEVILRLDDVPSGIYLIEKGFVKVYTTTESGEEKIHIIYQKGDLFPLIWVFLNTTKNVYYEALDKVTLRRIRQETFTNLIESDCKILMEVVKHLTYNLDVHIDRVDHLELTKAYPRLIAYLLFLAKRFGKNQSDGTAISVPLTHKDIANSTNMARETASREMEALQKQGLIRYKGRLLTIKDIKKLEKELSQTSIYELS